MSQNLFLAILGCILLPLSIILNSTGIFCLSKLPISNQRIILTYLSSTLICISSGALSVVVCTYLDYTVHNSIGVQYLVRVINTGIATVQYLVMIVICVDRLLCLLLGVRYKFVVSTRRINIAMVTAWFIALGITVVFFFLPFKYVKDVYIRIIYPLLDTIFLLLSIITYAYLIEKLKYPRSQGSGGHKLLRRKFLMPGVLILTNIILYLIPDYLFVFLIIEKGNDSLVLDRVLRTCWWIGHCSDPIVYIFMLQRVRKVILQMFKRKVRNVKTITNYKTKSREHFRNHKKQTEEL